MKKLLLLITLLTLSVSSLAQIVPKKGFYGGIGVSFNLVSFSESDSKTLGLSNAYVNGNLVSSGFAGGPFAFPAATENIFGPSAQIGYFQKFNKSNWLWGSKFTYNYIGSTTTSPLLNIPQAGSNNSGQSFTGDAVVQSYQNKINSQMTLTPYIGWSVKKTFFYLGAGVSYSQVKEYINDIVGYAYITTDTVNISGAPLNFSSSDWVFGFTANAGAVYFVSPSLFLDFSYNFNQTQKQTNNFMAPFSNSSGQYSTSGEMIGNTTSHAITNTFILTINKIF